MQHFFIFCSGADPNLLATCSAGERTKYAGIGATVFFTALMAFFAASYALYTVFDNYWISVFFGFIWGLLIFNLDRYIVSTIKKNGKPFQEFGQALPRLILAIIIAVVISKPLELKIFEKEINQVLQEERNVLLLKDQKQVAALYAGEVNAFAKAKQQLADAITAKEKEVNDLYTTYITEAEGTAGTNKLGKGPVYKEKRDKHDAALIELTALKATNTAKIAAIEAQEKTIKATETAQVASNKPVITNMDGLMARIKALSKLPFMTSFFIFLLFLAIETSPIIAKLLAPRGEYDYKFAEQEDLTKNWVLQQKLQQEMLVTTDTALNKRVYENLADEEAIYDYKIKMARELMKKQVDAFYEKQQSILG